MESVRTQGAYNTFCAVMHWLDNDALAAGQPHATPEEVFIAIETLLPTGKGEFLELWAAKGASKEGWTHVAQCDGNYK